MTTTDPQLEKTILLLTLDPLDGLRQKQKQLWNTTNAKQNFFFFKQKVWISLYFFPKSATESIANILFELWTGG